MNTSADAAEQVVRMSLETAEVTARITGAGAKQVAVLLYAILRDQKKTKGKVRLSNMIKSGKALKVFAVKDEELAKFCAQAKKYGVLYCVLRDKNASDGITDVMVREEDISKVNRIFQRFELATTDMASIKTELLRAKEKAAKEVEKDPTSARPEKPLSGHFSEITKEKTKTEEMSSDGKKPSVRKELNEIRKELNAKKDKAPKFKVPGKGKEAR